jgi:hypothetical protein
VMKENGDMDYYNKSRPPFNTYVQILQRFGRDKE